MAPNNYKIYRYRKINENNLKAFVDDKLYFSKASYYSDCFDSMIRVDLNKFINELISGLNYANNIRLMDDKKCVNDFINFLFNNCKNKIPNFASYENNRNNIFVLSKELIGTRANIFINELKNDLFNQIADVKSKISSICFTEKFDDIKIWDAYADGHKGFCLEYNIGNFSYFDNDNMVATLFPIAYSDEPYDFSSTFIPLYINNKFNFNLEYDYFGFFKMQLFKRKDYYSFENEWRLLNSNLEAKYINIKPTAIYLGIDIDIEYLKELVDIAKKKNIKIYKMTYDYSLCDYKLIALELKL